MNYRIKIYHDGLFEIFVPQVQESFLGIKYWCNLVDKCLYQITAEEEIIRHKMSLLNPSYLNVDNNYETWEEGFRKRNNIQLKETPKCKN
jgi:hypothetical protein